MKKTIITVIITVFATIFLILVVLAIFGFYLQSKEDNKEPDFNKILTKEEIKDVLDDTIFELGGSLAKFELVDTEDTKGYTAIYREGKKEVTLWVWDISGWSQETMDIISGKPGTTFETFVKDEYNRFQAEWDERAALARNVNMNPPGYTYNLQNIHDFDVMETLFPAGVGGDNDVLISKTLVGKHQVQVSISGDEPGLLLDSSVKLYVLIDNVLEALSE